MGIERFTSLLRSCRLIAIDTSILIYELEVNPRYFALSDVVFAWMEKRGNSAVTSTLSMAELLVPAYREKDTKGLEKYYGLLTTLPNLQWISPDITIADLAARLRADHGLKTPDAIHAATALHAKAQVFITNDPIFERVKELSVLVLDKLL